MHLYNLTLVSPSSITSAVIGQFSGTKQQEIVVCRAGLRLEFIRPDATYGKLNTVFEQNAFGAIRSLASFRLPGGTKDYLIIGSDAGRITVAEFNAKANAFSVVHQETFGRSGARRIVPGQYLATDPKGRAVMIAAVEKAKLVYVLNRDAAANLTISSPLEANKSNAIIHAIVGVDVGYENPIFAALEVDYEDADHDPTGKAFRETQKSLTYYELDLGLNHVVRKWSTSVDMRSNMLIQVPGGYNQTTERWDGPSGVLVCSEDHITYRHNVGPVHRVPIPRRFNPVEGQADYQASLIVASVCHRMKGAFFFLVQNEDGDLFKLTIDHEGEVIKALKIKYFDTVPVAASLCILRAGFLYVAPEAGPAGLYSFQKLGTDDDLPEYSSTDYPQFGMGHPLECPTFLPRPLENLLLTDETPALDPLVDAKFLESPASAPRIIAACGKGSRSHIDVMQHGLDVQEAISSELPGVPRAVWTTKMQAKDEFDTYIILSFVNGTLVLSIGETIEEVSDSGFNTSSPTLAVQQLGANSIVQIYPEGIRHIMPDKKVSEWNPPEDDDGMPTRIVRATSNAQQIVVALEPSNEIVYFELDTEGQLNEYQDRKVMGSAILALNIAAVPEGRVRTPFLAVGCQDQTVRIISLDPVNTLEVISMQALTAQPTSLCIAELKDMATDRNRMTTFVNVGLANGVLLRSTIDAVSGQLTDSRIRYLGTKPVHLVRVTLQDNATALLAISSRMWLLHSHSDRVRMLPLLYPPVDDAWTFSAEMCPNGVIGIRSGNLLIFTIPSVDRAFKVDSFPFPNTPRRIVHHPDNQDLLYVIGSDHRAMSEQKKQKHIADLGTDVKPSEMGVLGICPSAEYGLIRAEAGQWSSCLQIIDVNDGPGTSTFNLRLDMNEAATCLTIATFANGSRTVSNGTAPNGTGHAHGIAYLIVGSVIDAHTSPRTAKSSFVSVYSLPEGGRKLSLIHRTEVEDIPTCLHAFAGKVLVGIGTTLRLYDLGKKKLLRKCERRAFPAGITSITSQAGRIVVGDVQESTFFVTYKPLENRLIVFADDTVPRWTTSAMTMLDYDTICAGDKFGNIFVNRIDERISRNIDDDASGLTVLNDKPYLQGAPHKVSLEVHFHVGDIVTSVQKAALVPGGRPVIVYTCLGGTIGCLIALTSKSDVDMLETLESQLRKEAQTNLLGRDHMAFRGYYTPVKGVIDGDLCEAFTTLSEERQQIIAQGIDGRTPVELNKFLESMRLTSAL